VSEEKPNLCDTLMVCCATTKSDCRFFQKDELGDCIHADWIKIEICVCLNPEAIYEAAREVCMSPSLQTAVPPHRVLVPVPHSHARYADDVRRQVERVREERMGCQED
jgi:hypothetical protein